MKKNKTKILFILFIILAVLFSIAKITKSEFEKIENRIINRDLDIRITYTKREQLDKLLKENLPFFSEIITEIRSDENLNYCNEISIPFDYPDEDVKLYFAGFINKEEKEDIVINDDLRDKFIYLSNEFKINCITIMPDGNSEYVYAFYQTDFLDDTYIGIVGSPVDQNIEDKPTKKFAFTKYDPIRTNIIYKPIDVDSDYYWYYKYSRDIMFYSFWDRLYDIVYNNL